MEVDFGSAGLQGRDYLAGARVLIVEDSFLLAWELARFVRHAGGEVVGPCPDMVSAIRQFQALGRAITCAVIDVLLQDGPCYPLVRRLEAGGIPIVYVTGLASEAIDVAHRGHPVCPKPVDWDKLAPLLRWGSRDDCRRPLSG
jgi:DNA-binding response OmpR family regulator